MSTYKSKLQVAKDVLNGLRDKTQDEIGQMVLEQAGEDLCAFIMEYSRLMVERFGDSHRHEAAATLMLLGYLIRAGEMDVPAAVNIHAPKGKVSA